MGEARALLMLGAALVERVRGDLQHFRRLEQVDDSLRRVIDVIDKADLSYDRVVGGLAGTPRPGDQPLALQTVVDWAVTDASAAAGSAALVTAIKIVAEHFVAARDIVSGSTVAGSNQGMP